MTLVVDANAAATLATAGQLSRLDGHDPVAPALMWSEALAGIRQARWRGEIGAETESDAVDQLLSARIARLGGDVLCRRALAVERDLGCAKTYDAEYVALALMLDVQLFTLDGQLRRRVGSIVELADPSAIFG